MKLYLTATSERGKPATKGGQKYLEIEIMDENGVLICVEVKPEAEGISAKMFVMGDEQNTAQTLYAYTDKQENESEPSGYWNKK